MKKIGFILALLIAVIITSCKDDSLQVARDRELAALDKYVKDSNLEDAKDASGIYFKLLSPPSTDSMVTSGYKVMLHYVVALNNVDTTVVLSTANDHVHHFTEDVFYVDATQEITDPSPLQNVAGMHIALKKMRVGEKALVIIPSELAFKAVNTNTGVSFIPRFSTLLVTVSVVQGFAPPKK